MSDTFPRVDINIRTQEPDPTVQEQRVLLIGQKTSAGTAPSGQLVENIPLDLSEDTLFGENSMLAAKVREFKSLNNDTRVDAIPLDDPAGATATAQIDLATGSTTAGEDGEFTVIVGSAKNHLYTISVTSGDSPTTIGDAIETAVNADTKAPMTAANVAGVVTLTAVHAGTEANNIGISVLGNISGIVVTLTATAGGTLEPTLTGLFDPIESERYLTFDWPASYDFSVIIDELDDVRFNPPNDLLDGRAISATTGDFSTLTALGATLDSRNLALWGNQYESTDGLGDKTEGPAIFELDYVLSASISAQRSLRLEEGADLSGIVFAGPNSLDRKGGLRISGLPYANTPMVNLPLPKTGQTWTISERNQLNDSGISTLNINDAKTRTVLHQAVTTYKTNDLGTPDTIFKYLNDIDVVSSIRQIIYTDLKNTYKQYRSSPGNVLARTNILSKESVEGKLDDLYNLMSTQQYALTVYGEEYLQFFKENRSVELDLQAGQITIKMLVPIISQARVFIIDMTPVKIIL